MSSLSKNLERQYGEIYLGLRKIINEIDPVGLKGRIELESEYDTEMAVILGKIKECRSFDEVMRLVHGVFIQKFDPPVAGSPKRYKPIAKRLCEMMNIGGMER